jgi:hypothetical protein
MCIRDRKRAAWTTVTYRYNNPTEVYKLRKDQFVSAIYSQPGGTTLVYTVAYASAGTWPGPHTPVGGKVKIRFENNG